MEDNGTEKIETDVPKKQGRGGKRPGAGKPKSKEKKRLNLTRYISLAPNLWEEFNNFAEIQGRTRSKFLRDLINEAFINGNIVYKGNPDPAKVRYLNDGTGRENAGVSLERRIWEELDKIARQKNMGMSELIEHILYNGLAATTPAGEPPAWGVINPDEELVKLVKALEI